MRYASSALGLGLLLLLDGGLARAQPVPVSLVKAAQVNRLLREGAPVVLVDVRSAEEFRARHIRGAVSIPLSGLEARYREIPRQGLVVLY